MKLHDLGSSGCKGKKTEFELIVVILFVEASL